MIHPFGVTGFNRLTALSTSDGDPKKASRPFDLNRNGFVLGEGAGMIVLEELEHAKKRGATIHAELTGYGTTADAFRMTDSHPEGRGAIAAIQGALADASLNPTDVGYINAHGTSTQVNDLVESIAIKNVFGEAAYKTPISSTKSMLGAPHRGGRARSELITAVKTIQTRLVAAHDQLRDQGSGVRPRLRAEPGPREEGRARPVEQLRLRRPEHLGHRQPLQGMRQRMKDER